MSKLSHFLYVYDMVLSKMTLKEKYLESSSWKQLVLLFSYINAKMVSFPVRKIRRKFCFICRIKCWKKAISIFQKYKKKIPKKKTKLKRGFQKSPFQLLAISEKNNDFEHYERFLCTKLFESLAINVFN